MLVERRCERLGRQTVRDHGLTDSVRRGRIREEKVLDSYMLVMFQLMMCRDDCESDPLTRVLVKAPFDVSSPVQHLSTPVPYGRESAKLVHCPLAIKAECLADRTVK